MEVVMCRILFAVFMILPLAEVFAQEDHKPGVILLQVRQPDVVSFNAKLQEVDVSFMMR